ncbi:MAG: hypothetical protein AB7O26_10270, partial [Planctomycetaceae bacterium]
MYAPPGGMMPQQSFPAAPPGTYSSPGTLGSPAPAPAMPQQNNFQPPIQSSPGGGGNAPMWDGNSTGGASNSDGLVPAPHGDPNDLQGSPGAFNERNSRPMLSQVSGEQSQDARELAPATHETASAEPEEPNGPDPFEKPVEMEAAATAAAPVTHVAASGPNPYDYDREGYSWLRGVVDFDEESRTWHIIYNVKPSKDDKFSGAIQLLPDPELKTLRPNQVVHVEGAVDYNRLDDRGKPQY